MQLNSAALSLGPGDRQLGRYTPALFDRGEGYCHSCGRAGYERPRDSWPAVDRIVAGQGEQLSEAV